MKSNYGLKSRAGGNVIIKVKDTGIGIKPEDQKKLFEKFTRAEMGSRTHAGGSGLGLFIVKKIVTEHQGKVKIESTGESGKGTTFVVTLPIKQGSK
ncbi:MAG: HAMP domain-containing sensor histidine kinase [bacterium]